MSRTFGDRMGHACGIICTPEIFEYKMGTDVKAIVLGSEGKGMRRLTKELCDSLISIPMLGQVESLNVSVASGIFLSEIRRQRDLP